MGGLFVVPVTGSVNGIAVRSTHTHTPACSNSLQVSNPLAMMTVFSSFLVRNLGSKTFVSKQNEM
ncbi:hypothetical protein OUZ56_009332 [Daphnia magna]|uniref:Uncharacterized protein n=1 Tax=Daphnia magna TaxID=35525 RepID=A0ABR0AFN8_9CRUS|nr:hypothetical protein OUZ56_009332 [Daphnia magna]